MTFSIEREVKYGAVSAVDPYSIYAPGGRGLIKWGATEWTDQYCRLDTDFQPFGIAQYNLGMTFYRGSGNGA